MIKNISDSSVKRMAGTTLKIKTLLFISFFILNGMNAQEAGKLLPKLNKANVLRAGSGMNSDNTSITEVPVPGGIYGMGDHNGHWDPGHPDDEIPVHTVKIDSFNMTRTEITNQQFLAFLNSELLAGKVQVTNNRVHLTGDTVTIYYTYNNATYYSIAFDGTSFHVADFRAQHPVQGVMWIGAAAFCNWLSGQNNLDTCYTTGTWACDFTRNGFRLPTEAEWEYAARGGHNNPYLKFENSNTIDINQANLPNSGDPYETGPYPLTTPVGFYDGALKQKSDYNWPSSVSTYQTNNGINGYGLYDMQGNVWEFVNDWYSANYYSVSPYDNPKGPDNSFLLPDGKPYRGLRGGNWYNGIDSNGVNDGHSRVSNRDPSYFRGPQDPNHPWYHVGFRAVRKAGILLGTVDLQIDRPGKCKLLQNYPNPFSETTQFRYYIPSDSRVSLRISDVCGKIWEERIESVQYAGWHSLVWNAGNLPAGIYCCTLTSGNQSDYVKIILTK